ncbi:MAG: hypothetical protein H6819_03160 [Phycisphaerales bacterium]|nr:hypothetical protein [Phycisphaerales bacterium]MCB9856195.1 hypothetical protein [Phycisphaerales bacterium]
MISREDAMGRAAQYAGLIMGMPTSAFDVELLEEWEHGWFITFKFANVPSPENAILGGGLLFITQKNGRVYPFGEQDEVEHFKKGYRKLIALGLE